MNYAELMESDRWQRLRAYVWYRDRGRCYICGAPGIDTHHWFYQFGFFNPKCVNLLCRPCHLVWQGEDPNHLPDSHHLKSTLMEVARISRNLGKGKFFQTSPLDFLGD